MENIVAKGEIARFEQFFLLSYVFQKVVCCIQADDLENTCVRNYKTLKTFSVLRNELNAPNFENELASSIQILEHTF